jgi:Mrp family chromosome partitioning ATPase
MIKSPGISEYLQGLYEPEEIIRRSDFNENLFIIPAGSAPDAHPSELLENGRITELLNYSNEIFDWVIIDTAPVNAITDAYLLANKCDVTLYVIRHGYTPKVFIQRLDQNNKNNRLNNIAIVFNGIRPRGFGKHHYGYGYGYGYVYNENNKIRMET